MSPKKKKIKRSLKLAIDFDGTLAEHDFPDIGPEAKDAFKYLKLFKEKGAKLILWTMRSDSHGSKGLSEAVAFCKERGIEFDSINKGIGDRYWTTSNKAYCHIYIDDAAFGIPMTKEGPYTVDWSIVGPAVLEMIKKYRFFFHWNKPAKKWSVHYRNKCYIVDHLTCYQQVESKINKRQPLRVMQGFSTRISNGKNLDKTTYAVIY